MVVNASALKNMLNRKLSNTRVRRRLIALDKSVHFFLLALVRRILTNTITYLMNYLLMRDDSHPF